MAETMHIDKGALVNTMYSPPKELPKGRKSMATMTLRMSESDAEVAKKFAAFEGKSFSDFARDAIFEKIEDHYDLEELRAAIAEDSGKRYSQSQVLDELGL